MGLKPVASRQPTPFPPMREPHRAIRNLLPADDRAIPPPLLLTHTSGDENVGAPVEAPPLITALEAPPTRVLGRGRSPCKLGFPPWETRSYPSVWREEHKLLTLLADGRDALDAPAAYWSWRGGHRELTAAHIFRRPRGYWWRTEDARRCWANGSSDRAPLTHQQPWREHGCPSSTTCCAGGLHSGGSYYPDSPHFCW
ncbi:UNVERIFIED_CONTAM: hypothetical protein Slati_2469400 [Sesamum latifolium]|uniref:Uncharacterized protein n=1 Tax=Sesamum latifolium TaxID=2727402 RepID=A0AAW2WDS3_9LAMI